MSTAIHRRSGAGAGPERKTSARSVKATSHATEAIPVLIRLPRLRLETGEEDAAEQEGSDLRMTIPLTLTAEDSLRPDGATDDFRTTTDEMGAGPASAVTRSFPFIFRPSPWTRFHLPRWALHTGIAGVLLAVLVIAFSIIRQPQKSNGVAAGQSPDVPRATSSRFLSTGMPTPPKKPLAASAGADSQKPATDATAAAAASSPLVETVPMPAVNSQQNLAQAADIAPPRPDAAAENTPARPAASAAPSATPAAPVIEQHCRTATPDLQADVPLTGTPPSETISVSVGQLRYPATDPGTFQYPADYHERLRSRAGSPASRSDEARPEGLLLNGPAASEASVYGWQPHTARLQAPIEPPPIR